MEDLERTSYFHGSRLGFRETLGGEGISFSQPYL